MKESELSFPVKVGALEWTSFASFDVTTALGKPSSLGFQLGVVAQRKFLGLASITYVFNTSRHGAWYSQTFSDPCTTLVCDMWVTLAWRNPG
jgi:hypothetical protein